MSDVNEYVKKYVNIVDRVLAFIPYVRTKVWKDFFFNPTTVVSKNIDGLGQRVMDIYVMVVIGGLIGLVSGLPSFVILGMNPATGMSAVFLIGFMIAGIILTPLLYLFYAAIEFIVAKIVGGKGNYTAHFNASVLPTLATFVILLPIDIVMIPVQWASLVPILGLCLGILSIPLGIASIFVNFYGLYLKYKAFREVHKLTMWKSIAVVFVPVFILVGLIIAAFVMFYAVIMAAVLGSAAAGTMISPGINMP